MIVVWVFDSKFDIGVYAFQIWQEFLNFSYTFHER